MVFSIGSPPMRWPQTQRAKGEHPLILIPGTSRRSRASKRKNKRQGRGHGPRRNAATLWTKPDPLASLLGFPVAPHRPRLRPARESTLRIVAQPGQSACSGCKRSPVRIRPVRPIFEPFDLGYCESSRSPTRRPAVRSLLAQSPFEPKLLGYHNKRNVNLHRSAQAGRFPGANSEAGSPKTTRGQTLARNPQATPGPFLSS